MTETRLTRAERRARTRASILAAARQIFGERGYQKATIRAVAERVDCDPSLVMHHFRSKQELFRAAAELEIDVERAFSADEEGSRSERVLRHTFEQLDRHPDRIASTLRSMLTHDEIADEALQLFKPPAHPQRDDQVDLGRELLMALTLGTAITRYVLKATAIETATVDQLLERLLPAAHALYPDPA